MSVNLQDIHEIRVKFQGESVIITLIGGVDKVDPLRGPVRVQTGAQLVLPTQGPWTGRVDALTQSFLGAFNGPLDEVGDTPHQRNVATYPDIPAPPARVP